MKIKVTEKNAEKINAMLEEINGKAREHTFFSWHGIDAIVDMAESKLEDLFLPKKDWIGAQFWAQSSDPMPNSYKWKRIGNWVRVQRFPSGWFIVGLGSEDLYPNEGGQTRLVLTWDQDEAVINRVRQQYGVAA